MHKIWKIKEYDQDLSKHLAAELEIPLLIAQLLVNRGVTEADIAQKFLNPSLSDLYPPWKMKGISDAVERIKKAISSGEKIYVYGDYDVDGITSVSLLLSCLKHLGANVDYYIPNRLDEGYGLGREGVIELKSKDCKLIITVDCGISAIEEVKLANESGMDVIITDHHEPRDKIPPALVVLDPKIDGIGYPFNGLAGVGVAFKLAQALMGDENGQDQKFLNKQLDLVALGTIADVVPLIGENRTIAKYGIDVLNKMERVGIKALCEVSGIPEGGVSSGTVGFRLGPRINAAGRLDTAHCAVKLLTTDSYEEALEIAQKLDAANKERQNIERQILDKAKYQMQKVDLAHEKGLILAEEGWHHGVIGIVASRIQEQFYRPTILISLDGDMGRGSARSIPEFDIFHALSQCSHLLEKFGGHKAAAGLSITKGNIGKFRKEFSEIINETLKSDDLKPKLMLDAKITMDQLSEEAVEQLSLLEPYGLGNPRPLLMMSDLSLKGLPRVVGQGKHLQISVTDGRSILRSIGFNMGNLERELYNQNVSLDLAFLPFIDTWNDNRYVKLRLDEVVIHRSDTQEVAVASAELMELSKIKIADRRNFPDKARYIQKLLDLGEKAIFYVRDDPSVDQFQKIVSKNAPKAKLGLCYNKMGEDELDQIKIALSESQIDAVSSCVPFEEPIPGLRHLVFCHPILSQEKFIRCCAPAVETEEQVYIHLIFSNKDIELDTLNLNSQYPDRQMLVNVYRRAKDLSSDKGNEPLTIEEIAAGMTIEGEKEAIISSCMAIFGEIGLVKLHEADGKPSVIFPSGTQEKRDLKDSNRYALGEKIRTEWIRFSDFLLKKTPEDFRRLLLETIQ